MWGHPLSWLVIRNDDQSEKSKEKQWDGTDYKGCNMEKQNCEEQV